MPTPLYILGIIDTLFRLEMSRAFFVKIGPGRPVCNLVRPTGTYGSNGTAGFFLSLTGRRFFRSLPLKGATLYSQFTMAESNFRSALQQKGAGTAVSAGHGYLGMHNMCDCCGGGELIAKSNNQSPCGNEGGGVCRQGMGVDRHTHLSFELQPPE